MNSFKLKILFSIAFLSLAVVSAQSDADRAKIIKEVDQQKHLSLLNELRSNEQSQREKAKEIALQRGLPLEYKDQNGNLFSLLNVDIFGEPVYTSSYNLSGANNLGANQLYSGGSLGLNISGQGMVAGIWDGGHVLNTHLEVDGKITFGDFGSSISDHGTHVGGTIASSGAFNLNSRGVAHNARLVSYYWDDDTTEMVTFANQGWLVSNHSYGNIVDQSTNPAVYGKYNNDAKDFDNITYLHDYYLPVIAAGNNRNDGLNTVDAGHDLLTDMSVSKNSMVVGAVSGFTTYSDPSSIVMSTFSSWGPTDDGRIKPDIVAKGVNVLSLNGSTNQSYSTSQGTSMAAPMVTGGVLLLQQLYNQQKSSYLRSASVKGLVLLTAKEAGTGPGPDYRFGWGYMDVAAGANFILNLDNTTFLAERELANNTTFSRTVTSNGTPLKVGLSWTDPAGNLPSVVEDDPQPALINDLDIKLTDANGTDHFPWKLDPSIPLDWASKAVNNVDNIEIVEIDFPAGTYTITVSHKGTLAANQKYTLLINGAAPGTLSNRQNELNDFVMYPNPAQDNVTVSFNNQLSGSKIRVEVYDILGQRVTNLEYANTGNFEQRIDISALNSGIYIVKVGDGNVASTRKLIIN